MASSASEKVCEMPREIVINQQYGDFGLSKEAIILRLYAFLKGVLIGILILYIGKLTGTHYKKKISIHR
jgi:hypothetical protein